MSEPLRVLLVEDDLADAELLRRDLRRGGYEPLLERVETAGALAAALRDAAWDVVISDYALPQFDGLAALTMVRGACPDLPFILMSGVVDEETAAEAMVHGAQDLVLKSRRARLLPALERELAEARLRREKREGEAQAAAVLDGLATHIAVLDETGTILTVNKAWREFAAAEGADVAQVCEGANYLAVCDQVVGEATYHASAVAAGLRDVLAGRRDTFVLDYTCHSPMEQRWFTARATPVRGGGLGRVIVAHENVTALRQLDEERRTVVELLGLLNREGDLHALLTAVTAYLQLWSGCEAAGVRLRDGDDFPYFETRGFPAQFVRAESRLCVLAGEGADREPVLACMCGNVLQGRTDPALPFFTAHGSFWSNCTTELLATTTPAERQGHTRNRCNTDGYESVALVPLRAAGQTFGLLQLNDPRPGRFSPAALALLERMADSIAIALAQRQAQAALAASEARYRQLVDTAGEGIWVIDSQQRTTFVNHRLLELLGYAEAEMLGRPVTDFMDPADLPQHHQRMDERRAGLAGHYEGRYRARDGGERWMMVSAAPQFRSDGAFDGSVGMYEDITERRRAQGRLRESEERFRSVSSVVADFAYSCRQRQPAAPAELDWLSGNVERVCGYTPDELLARRCWGFLIEPDDQALFDQSVANLAPGAEAVCELRIRTRQGEVRWVRSSARCECDPDDPRLLVLYGGCVDITADRERQEMLRLQALVLDQIQDRVTVTDLAGRIRYVNQAQARAFHVDAAELVGQHVKAYGEDPLRGATQQEIIETTLRDGSWSGRVVNRDAAGREMVLEARTSIVRDAGGQPIALSGSATDVTERVVAEAALRASEERFRTIANFTSDWETWISPGGKLLWISPAVVTFTGYTDAECYAMPDYPVPCIHPEDLALVKQHFAAAVGGATCQDVDFRVRRTDGETRWVSACYRSVVDADGRRLGHRTSLRDITARKQAEAALRQSEEKFALAFRSSPDAVVLVRLADRQIVDVNDGFCRLTGYSHAEAVGSSGAALGLWASSAEADRCNARLRVTGSIRDSATEFRTRAGDVRQCLLSAEVVQLAGEPHALYLVRDETERRQAEAERARLQEQLLQAQRMESVGRLAGGVAHDFNNMLGVILGNAELAMADLEETDPLWADLHEIRSTAQRSAELTAQLLAFARRQTAAPQVLDLNDSVAGALKMLRRLIGEDVDLAWLPGPNLWSVHMDPAQVGQILTNLCVNARDAIAGVGRITIETANVTLSDAAGGRPVDLPGGEYVCLVVTDDGAGMEPDVLDHLFEPFFTTKPVGEGTGLGLATVYGITKQNGGGLTVASTPGQGAAFQLYLPRVASPLPDGQEPTPARPPRGQGQTILVVEDDLATLKLTQRILSSLGYGVQTASSPAAALELAAALAADDAPPALLLTDVVMPQMSGRELAERVTVLHPQIRCLFMSGYTADVIAHRGVLDEGVQFVGKPFSVTELAQKVREALDDAPADV